MMGLSGLVFIVITLLFQVQAQPADNEYKEKLHHLVDVLHHIDIEAIHRQLSESQPSLGQMILGAKNTFFKIQNCKVESKQELIKLAKLQFNYEGCINATRDIANFEVFLLDTFHFAQFLSSNLLDVAKNVLQCHTVGDIFDILKCVVVTLQNSGTEFDQIFSKLYDLISELQVDSDSFNTHVKACFGFSKSTVALQKALHIIYNQC